MAVELLIGLGAGTVVAIVVFLLGRKSLSDAKTSYGTMLSGAEENYVARLSELSSNYESRLSETKANYEQRLSEAKENYRSALAELKENQEKAVAQQVKAIRAEMTARTEEILKVREEELGKKAEETFKSITGTLGKDLDEMKKSFNENRKAQTESSAEMKANLENAVKHLREQTENIGMKADHLADALKGRNKMQGCFGETILANILEAEGFREGIEYDKEATLKDEMGMVIANEDSGKRMRPDVIVHFPDNTDIVVDSKVDLKALSDWYEAEDEAARNEAAARNLKAVRAQVDNLSKKDYTSYIASGRKTLDYVVMFIPIYNSFQLAKEIEPGIWREAYRKNVLITTEETLVPFLRMIRTAWCNVEQVRNQQNIIKAAEEMIARVSDMAAAHAKLGDRIEDVRKYYEACDRKLKDSGQSIIVSANKVISYGVKQRAGKPLPALYGQEETGWGSVE